jgi:hypothetical protein
MYKNANDVISVTIVVTSSASYVPTKLQLDITVCYGKSDLHIESIYLTFKYSNGLAFVFIVKRIRMFRKVSPNNAAYYSNDILRYSHMLPRKYNLQRKMKVYVI